MSLPSNVYKKHCETLNEIISEAVSWIAISPATNKLSTRLARVQVFASPSPFGKKENFMQTVVKLVRFAATLQYKPQYGGRNMSTGWVFVSTTFSYRRIRWSNKGNFVLSLDMRGLSGTRVICQDTTYVLSLLSLSPIMRHYSISYDSQKSRSSWVKGFNEGGSVICRYQQLRLILTPEALFFLVYFIFP